MHPKQAWDRAVYGRGTCVYGWNKVADNQVLQLKQEDIKQRGHAIECRICAEDTEMNFMPSPGIIKQITEPNGIGVRIDSYVYEGYEIPIYYDPMIGKLIVWATNRDYAIERMRRVLHEYKLTGVKNNISYLRAIMDTPDFVKGHYDTGFIAKNGEHLKQCIMRTSERAENIYGGIFKIRNGRKTFANGICPGGYRCLLLL